MNRPGGWIVATAAALLAAVTALIPARAQTASDVRQMFVGTFNYAGGDAQRVGVNDAIDRAVAPMNIFIRSMARGRLRERNPVYATITVRLPPGRIEVAMTGRPLFASPDDGTAAPWRGTDGGNYRLRQRFDGGHLVQEIGNNDGTRRNTLVLAPDGRWLVMNVRIASARLPRPVEYALSYRR